MGRSLSKSTSVRRAFVVLDAYDSNAPSKPAPATIRPDENAVPAVKRNVHLPDRSRQMGPKGGHR